MTSNICCPFFYLLIHPTLHYAYYLYSFYASCSTVDQFSGESAPVVLPLDDRQVSKITPHMVEYKELIAELVLACLAKIKKFTFNKLY